MLRNPESRRVQLRAIAAYLAAIAVFAFAVPATPSLAGARLCSGQAGEGGLDGGSRWRQRRPDVSRSRLPFRVSGLSLGVTAGASVSRLKGWASGIRQVSDFAGSYSSVGAGGAFVGGVGGVHLANQKGVRMELQGPRAGMEFAANLSEVRISLK